MLHALQVADLDAGSYNITAKAVNADGTEASAYSRVQYSITVTAPGTVPDPPDTTIMDGPPPTETPSAIYNSYTCSSSRFNTTNHIFTALIAACIHCILKLLPVVALLLHSNAD